MKRPLIRVFLGVRRVISMQISARMNSKPTIDSFVALFPPLKVYKKESPATEYLAGKTEGRSNQHITIEELILLYVK